MSTSKHQTTSRTVLVTGASSGIGRAICERLLQDGHEVVGIARDFTKFPCSNPSFHAFSLDLMDLESLPRSLQTLFDAHAGVDAAILNAGRGLFGSLEQFSFEQIRSLIDLNFTSHAIIARAILPKLKRGGKGDLVFIGSDAALRGRRMGSLYSASKFAVRGFAQALREECARSGVRVSMVHPGMVRTPFYKDLDFGPGEEEENAVLPEDVARTVSFILSARPGTVFEEIQLAPLKRVVRFPSGKEKGPDSPDRMR